MPNTPPDPDFLPRKEFIRHQRTANVFCLLAISGSSFIRLYSFPTLVIASLRRHLEQLNLITAFREDLPQGLYEFNLEGKLWSSPKSVNSERLIIDLFTIVYQHGYTFLSSIDYGREHDDRLAVAFSKPVTSSPSPRSGSPMPGSPMPRASTSNTSSTSAGKVRRVPFAVSFPSATMLRVIKPPLHSTPAILQAVRSSWPRGVVSEKKIGDAAYEFKLKGYKWFQEDTFASDSLRHILTLLASLDSHEFTLMTSLSLTGRSRVKDLWIFTGVVTNEPHETDVSGSFNMSASHVQLPRVMKPESSGYIGPVPQHRRNPSAPEQNTPHSTNPPYAFAHPPPATLHTRAATEQFTPQPHSPLGVGGILRKPAPRAQVPVSVNLDASLEMEPGHHGDPEQFMAVLPSVISTDVENMTGVGAVARVTRDPSEYMHTPDVLYETNAERDYMSIGQQHSQAYEDSVPAGLEPIQALQPRLNSPDRPGSAETAKSASPTRLDNAQSSLIPALLGSRVFAAGAFRDSAFSTTSDTTQEIPIKWTGEQDSEAPNAMGSKAVSRPGGSQLKRGSTIPHLPGGWVTTPNDELEGSETVGREVDIQSENHADPSREGPEHDSPLTRDKQPDGAVHDVDARVTSPELVRNYAEGGRKSEAGLIGMMGPEGPPPPVPVSTNGNVPVESRSPIKREGTGNGWVLVNIEGRPHPGSEPQNESHGSTSLSSSPPSKLPPSSYVSPFPKSGAVFDSRDSNMTKGKGKGKANSVSNAEMRPGGFKRLFSFSKKGDGMEAVKTDTIVLTGDNTDPQMKRKPSRTRLRDRIKLVGVPEASPRSLDDKRLSID